MNDSSSDRDPIEVLAEEFMERKRRGENPTLREYEEKYPDLAADIRDLFPALVVIEDYKPVSESGNASLDEGLKDSGGNRLRELGDYRILREVGRGGMGVVYEAEQVSLGRRVALKVLPQQSLLNAKQRYRFEREARSAARLHHTNIVPIFGVGEQDGWHYYVMQFIQGLGLDEVLEELKRLRESGAAGASPPQPGELRVSRKDVSATMVAHSLMTGSFAHAAPESDAEPIVPRRQGPATAAGALAATVAHSAKPVTVAAGNAAAGPKTGARCDPTIQLEPSNGKRGGAKEQAHSTANSRLSDTFSLSDSFSGSSVSFLGGSESGERGRPKKSYWHSLSNIGMQVASALHYAHDQGILHRDIKPSNLLLDTRGTVWVTDFGLAKADDQQNLTHTGDILGTLRYMPPEAFEGQSDARSDVYSLGLTLYELIALQPAFDESERNKLIKQVTTGEPARLSRVRPDAPRDLVTIVHKAVDREPSRRYQTASELADDLDRFIHDEPIRARRLSHLERVVRWARHNRAIAGLSAAIAVILLVVSVASGIAAIRMNLLADSRQAALDAVVFESDAKQVALGAAEKAKERAQQFAADNRRSLVRFNAEQGAEFLERGDPFGSLPWFAEALALDEDPQQSKLHRIRLATTLRYAPKLVHCWTTRPGAGRVSFSPEGTYLAVTNTRLSNWVQNRESTWRSSPVYVWDVATGAATPPLTHDRAVFTTAFSPKGDRLVTVGLDETARIWDPKTGQVTQSFKVQQPSMLFAAFSPDGQRLLTGGSTYSFAAEDRRVQVWDAKTGVRAIDLVHPYPVLAAAFSPDGRRITAAAGALVYVWDAANGAPVGQPLRGTGKVVDVTFAADGQSIVAFELDGSIRLWDIHSGEAMPAPRANDVSFRALSPDRRRVAAVLHQSNAFQVWDLTTGQPSTRPLEHELEITEVAFSDDGKLVVSAGRDHAARVWVADSGRLLAVLRHSSGVISTAFHSSGRMVATLDADGQVRVWDLAGMEPTTPDVHHDAYVHHTSFSPDGRYLATASADGTARLWDSQTGQPHGSPLRHDRPVVHLAFSRDGKLLVTSSDDSTARVWDVETAKPRLARPLPHDGPVNFAEFSPDGATIVTASDDGSGRLWNATTGDRVGESMRHRDRVLEARFSPDGNWVVTASSDKKARIWDARTGKARTEEIWHAAPVSTAMFSSDSRAMLTAAAGTPLAAQQARLWDAATGRPLGPPLPHADAILDATIANDPASAGEWLVATASSDSTARVWNGRTGAPITAPLRHESHVVAVKFSPDSRQLATASRDGNVRVFDVRTGILITPPLPHGNLLTRVAFHPSGNLVAAASVDGRVQLWNVSRDDRPVEAWRAMAGVVSGQRMDTRGAALPAVTADVQRAWQSLPESFRAESRASDSQVAAWSESLLIDARRSARRQQARAAAEEAAVHFEAGEWDASIAAYRKAVELSRADYDFPLLHSLGRILDVPLTIGDDPQDLLKKLGDDEPRFVTLWLDEKQVQERPASVGLNASRQLILGVIIANEANGGGVRVTGFRNFGRAETAGLQVGDLITHVDGVAVAEGGALRRALSAKRLGQNVAIRVNRGAIIVNTQVPVVAEFVDTIHRFSNRAAANSAEQTSPTVESGFRPLFAASTSRGRSTLGSIRDGKRTQALYGVPRETVLAQLEVLPNGYLPIWMHADGIGADQQWTVIWGEDEGKRAWRQHDRLSLEELHEQLSHSAAEGWRPTVLCGYGTALGDTRYWAVWIKDVTPHRVALHQTEAELRSELAALPKNWRPERIYAYRETGQRRFNTIFIEDPAITRWSVHLNVPDWAAQLHHDKLSRERYLLVAESVDATPTTSNAAAFVEDSERGKALADAGQLEAAAEAFAKASAAATDQAEYSLRLAQVRVRQERWDEAAAALRERFRRLAATHSKANANLSDDAQPTSAPATWQRFAWSVTGPYPSDDEGTTIVGIEPRPDTPPKAPEPVVWSMATHQASDNLNLDARHTDQPGVYYARQHIYSERAEPVAVQVGRDPTLRVWLNASLVHEGAGSTTGIAPLVDVALRPGWNTFIARLVVPRKHQLLARWYVEPSALAREYESHERHAEALAEWSREIVARPKDHLAWVARGRVAAKLKRYGDAVADFEKALELRPNDQALRYELTLIHADWSVSLADEPTTAKQSEQLADQAVTELRRTLALGTAGLNYIQASVASEPRLAALAKRRDFQDLLAKAVDPGDLADIIYHRFGDMGGGFWASNQSLQTILDFNKEMTEQDSRPYYISADQQADGPTFAACWQSDGKPFRTNLHATWQEIERARSELPEGFLPTSLDAYRYGNELRWMAVWTREESPPAWRIETDLSRDALESRRNELKAQRFHPTLINSYTDLQNRLRFAVVWVQDQAECDVHLKLTADEVRKKLDALASGWRPLWLEGYLEDGQRYVAAIFINDGKSPEWKVATNQPSTAILAQIREIRFDRFWAVQQSLTVDPANTPAIQRRAELYTKFGRNDDAIAELSRGIALAPDQVELYRARAKLHATSGNAAEAEADYAAALKLKPDEEDLRVERGRLAAYRHTRIAVPNGSEWKWLHPTDGVDPAAKESAFRTTFFRADYDDRHWNSGRDTGGGFGYGETVGVDIGVPAPGQRLTAYFRHRFVTKEPLENVTLSCQRDDGLIVYLDGVEVARDNMRSGLDTYDLRAETAVEGPTESRIVVLPIVNRLPPGEHVLAISLHSQSSRSSDLRIANLEVRGSPLGAEPQDVRDPQLLADRAVYFQRENDIARAETDYAAALALAPDAADIALRRGRFLASLDRWKDAIADFDVVIRQRADDAQLLVERAMLHARLGARAAALADLTQATKLRPNDVSFRRQQGQLYALLDGNVIVPATSRWRWLHPTDGIDPATQIPDFHSTFFKLDFDDSAWREDRDAPGEKGGFGYGQDTAVDIGTPASGRRLSAYFRHKFRTDAAYDSLSLSLRRDDGVIVYLDGVEVARDNVRSATPEAYRLLANDGASNPARQRAISIPRELPPGDHVLTISLHNSGTSSGDLVLGGVALLGSRREVAETSLDDLEALSSRADTFVQMGHIDRALSDWTRMIELAPDDMQPLLKRADANYAAERWEQAVADYLRLAERFEPRNLSHYYRSQACLKSLRRFQESRAVADEAIKIAVTAEQRGEYLALRGYAWVLEGQWDRAADDYAEALAAASKGLHMNHLRDATTTFAAAGRMEECIKARDQMLERMTPGEVSFNQEDIRALLVAPLTTEQAAKVESIAEDRLTSFRGILAGVDYRAGRFQDALDRLDASSSFYHEYRFVRALALMRLGQTEQSRAALAEANARVQEEIAAAPGELPFFALDWQRIIAWRREATEAIVDRPLAELDRALNAEPTNSKLRAERGRLALAVGKLEEALVDLNEAIANQTDDPWAYAGRGDLYAQQNRWDEAAADYLMALRLSPADADLVSRLDKIASQVWLGPVAADAEREPVEWRRVLTQPAANWAAMDFDDQAWETVSGPFGTNTRASDRGRTAWTTSDIWLRREFQIAELPQEMLVIRSKFDDAVDVYINGVRAAQSSSYGNYRILPCLGPAAAALRTGRNVLAVHGRNKDGRGFVDVGIYTNPGPRKLIALLDELVAKQPQAVALLAKRCELLVQLERWDLAAADAVAVRALEPEPKADDYWNREVPSRTARLIGSNTELFDRVNKLQPGDYLALVARGKHLAEAGRWKDLAPILAAALEVKPNDHMAQSTYARLLAYLGDVDAYRRFRDDLMDRYRTSDDELGVYTASQACVLLDDSEFDWNLALAIAERSLELSRGEKEGERVGRQPTRNLVLALARFRLGDIKTADAAVQLVLDESLNEGREFRRATCLTVRALIRQRESKTAEARELLAEADAIVRTGRSASAAGGVGEDWREWLRYEVLRVQAVRTTSNPQR